VIIVIVKFVLHDFTLMFSPPPPIIIMSKPKHQRHIRVWRPIGSPCMIETRPIHSKNSSRRLKAILHF